MALPVESWYQSIFLRHSERSYSDEPVSEKDLSKLEETCREFRPYEGARAELVRSPPDDVFRGAVGSYGKVKGAPHYVAFVGDNDTPTVDIALGYMGEGIILEATALGLNTCWVAGFFRPEVVRKHIDVADSEYVAGVTPIGYAENPNVRIDSLRNGHAKLHQRQQLRNLILSDSHPPKQWMTKSLEAARLAPSAINRQPWRFLIDEDSITVSEPSSRNMFGRISYRLDCGIAMLHLELGAFAAGTRGKWTILEKPQVAKFQIV
jgi:nitroreductase